MLQPHQPFLSQISSKLLSWKRKIPIPSLSIISESLKDIVSDDIFEGFKSVIILEQHGLSRLNCKDVRKPSTHVHQVIKVQAMRNLTSRALFQKWSILSSSRNCEAKKNKCRDFCEHVQFDARTTKFHRGIFIHTLVASRPETCNFFLLGSFDTSNSNIKCSRDFQNDPNTCFWSSTKNRLSFYSKPAYFKMFFFRNMER
jgi:hypothetical protein